MQPLPEASCQDFRPLAYKDDKQLLALERIGLLNVDERNSNAHKHCADRWKNLSARKNLRLFRSHEEMEQRLCLRLLAPFENTIYISRDLRRRPASWREAAPAEELYAKSYVLLRRFAALRRKRFEQAA